MHSNVVVLDQIQTEEWNFDHPIFLLWPHLTRHFFPLDYLTCIGHKVERLTIIEGQHHNAWYWRIAFQSSNLEVPPCFRVSYLWCLVILKYTWWYTLALLLWNSTEHKTIWMPPSKSDKFCTDIEIIHTNGMVIAHDLI